jgi:hypothetical protein
MAFTFRDPIRCCHCGFRLYERAPTDVEYEQKFARKQKGRRQEGEGEED